MRKHIFKVPALIAALLLVPIPLSSLRVSADNSSSDDQSPSEADNYYATELSSYESYSDAFKILDLVNTEREKENLSPLTMDQSLLDTAMMRGYETEILFDHTRPDGSICFTANNLMNGENIAAAGSAELAMKLWMNSDGHRANILAKRYKSIGIGAVKSGSGMTYFVQCFGDTLQQEASASEYSDHYSTRTIQVSKNFLCSNAQVASSSNHIAIGSSAELSININNSFIIEKGFHFNDIQFISSDPSIVSISGNKVIGLKPGTVTITAQLGENPESELPTELTFTVNSPWQHDSNGWWYLNNDNTYPRNTWMQIDGKWYYFNASGYMLTGWLSNNDSWYYLNSDGAMATGWVKSGNAWYYMLNSGMMAYDWQSIDNSWYLFNSSGAMQTGWQFINNIWYFFNSSGAMQTGWQFIDNIWYFFNSSGAMQTGWQFIGNIWYFFNSSGAMQTGWRQIGGNWYFFNSNGAMITSSWIGDYYLSSDGHMATNTTTPDGYQVGSDGRWIRSNALISGTSYVVNKNTMKFHYPWCSKISTISSSNRADVGNSRNSLMDLGYEPCHICNP